MRDPDEKAEYENRKEEKKQKFIASFDNKNTGSAYVPTKEQHNFCMFQRPVDMTDSEIEACNHVITGYIMQEKIDHHYIHIVNKLRRNERT